MSGGKGSVSTEDWVNSWAEGDTAFHQSKHDRFLDNKKDEFFGGKKSVFLPLCGKTFDILWLYNQGHTVCGVEIAEQAIQEFFQENNIEFDVENIDNVGKLYKSKDKRIRLYVADMFDMNPELCGQFDIIFDSKAFVAINKDDRQKYVDTILALMKKDGQYYLATIEYDSTEWPGPPHSSPKEVVTSCYGEPCNVGFLENEDQVIKRQPSAPSTSGEAQHPMLSSAKLPVFIATSSYAIFRWYKMTFKQS